MSVNSKINRRSTSKMTIKSWFEYRFTKYYYSNSREKFVPIEFDYYKPYSYLLSTYQDGVKEGVSYDNIVEKYGK
jgi:hypothetical protein